MKRIALVAALLSVSAHGGKPKPPAEVCAELRQENANLRAENEALRAASLSPPTPAPPPEPSPAPPEDDVGAAGFGRLRWGASKDAFLRIYKDAKQSDGFWVQSGKVAGLSAMTGFRFADDQLAAVVIVFTEDFQNKTNYLYEHERIRKLLEQKYGTATTASRDIWLGDRLYKDNPGEWGMAVATGRLSRWSVWELPETEIELGTTGDNFKITNKIVYRSTRLKDLLKKEEQAATLGGL